MNRFLVVEGPDGSGKSTLSRLLRDHLEASGKKVTLLREPGATPLGEKVREILQDPDLEIGPRAETLLFCAARAELAGQIRQALEEGWVILDRYEGSTFVYQGIVRQLGNEVLQISRWASEDLRPDLTLVLLLDTKVSRARRANRAEDRMESSTDPEQVLLGYRELAKQPGHVEISAEGEPKAALAAALRALDESKKH